MSVKMTWHGDKAKRRARDGAEAGLLAAAQHILAKSEPLVPVAPVGGGYLKDAGVASVDGGQLKAAISYITGDTRDDGRQGGGNLAVVVHEDMTASHARGQAKYLEQPFNAEKDEALHIIARHIKGKLGA